MDPLTAQELEQVWLATLSVGRPVTYEEAQELLGREVTDGLVGENPRAADESLLEWAMRMRRLCDAHNIFLPRPFYARCRATA